MQDQLSPVRAAIDIGSNTIHIVVARCTPDDLDIVEDQVEMVRIGESVNATGEISQQKRDAAIATLKKYKDLAEQHGADQIFAVATEAIRKATNSSEFLQDVQRETGLEVHIVSGTVEAVLTFLGATYELYSEPDSPSQVGVMDLGGGSLELIIAKKAQITWRTSVPIGSGWLHDRYLPSDPPTYEEIAVADTFLQTYLQNMGIKRFPPVLVVTGGSANSLLRLIQRAFHLDMGSNRLTHDDLVRCMGLLLALPAEEIAQRYEQPVDRARILPAGALIIQKVMDRLGLEEIRVSSHGIREGVLLAYARYGDDWLEKINESAEAADQGKEVNASAEKASSQDETFAQSGRRMLVERTKKMLDWCDEVLKHEDVEAVHKMRVASRRLRATLDAYESCCNPKVFKKLYRQVKIAADNLGAARDTDVMLQNLQAQMEQMTDEDRPGVEWLMERLKDYRQERQRILVKFLHSLDEDALKEQATSCIPEGVASNGKSQTH
jgi:exopolyphosphatase/pppGpp-phosphohydrolase